MEPKIRGTQVRASLITGALLLAFLPTSSATAAASESVTLEIRSTQDLPIASSSIGTQIAAVMAVTSATPTDASMIREVTLSFTPDNPQNLITNTAYQLKGGYQRCLSQICTDIYYAIASITPPESGTYSLLYTTKTSTIAATQHIDVWEPQIRATKDEPDVYRGFQIKPVYVVPSDISDAGRDIRGQISTWTKQGSHLLDSQIADHWQTDTRIDGEIDVLFWQSKYTQSELLNSNHYGFDLLINEIITNKPTSGNRKLYLFYIEGPKIGGEGSNTCGYTFPGRRAVIVATGTREDNTCQRARPGIDFPAYTAVHETLHSLGVVQHVEPTNDLMNAVNGNGPVSIDKEGLYYRGANKAGIDILKLRIWAINPQDTTKKWLCPSQGYTSETWYNCALGISTLIPTQALCWSDKKITRIQKYASGRWVTIGKATAVKGAGCSGAYPYTYQMAVSQTAPGLSKYRLSRGTWTSKPIYISHQY